MARVVVQSRSGNVVLAILGLVYVLAAIVILIALTTEAWNAAAIVDRAIQLSLLASAACGAAAGFAAMFEHALPPGTGQRWRRRAGRAHLYVAWPLPLLITFHVLTFYYF